MGRNLPNGNRIYVKPKIGGKVVACRMKKGTADFLGLKAQPIEKGKGTSIKRGAMGTKSFTLLLKQTASVGGAKVVSLDHPVPGSVKVLDFYKYAKGYGKVAGIRTPDGIAYMWANWAGSGGGGGGLPSLPDLNPFDGSGGGFDAGDLGDIIDGIGDIMSGSNPYIEGIEALIDVLGD